MSEIDKKYIEKALELAERGRGQVQPNPMVGCLIVKEGRILGAGWHERFGGPHAEINALQNCRNEGNDPTGSDMYVTLEPCCHHGKTGPCTEAIIKAGISRVVAAMVDPSAHAGGKGLEQLRRAGIKVQSGLCARQARLLNAPFVKYARTGNCWVILKWAQSIDGKLAYGPGVRGRWITGQPSREDVHKLRRQVQGILVGVETVLTDDPLLTARPAGPTPLRRIVLDVGLRIPLESQLVRTAADAPVCVFTSEKAAQQNSAKAAELKKTGVEVTPVPCEDGRCDLNSVLEKVSAADVQQLMVEGGAEVLGSFLKASLADELCVYVAPKILGQNGRADISNAFEVLTAPAELSYSQTAGFGGDVRIRGLLPRAAREIAEG